MIEWKKTGKSVGPEGTTVIYQPTNIEAFLTIESRKRHIPHAGGREGTWDHTSYFLLDCAKEVKEFMSLTNAKRYAEEYYKEGENVNFI